MPQIASHDEVKAGRTQREIPGGYAWRTNFLLSTRDAPERPMAFLAEGTAKRVIKPHFHDVDQFQIIVSGGGVLGKSPLAIRMLKSAFNAELDGQAGIQELAGNATMLYYMTEEAKEFMTAQREKRKPAAARFPWLP